MAVCQQQSVFKHQNASNKVLFSLIDAAGYQLSSLQLFLKVFVLNLVSGLTTRTTTVNVFDRFSYLTSILRVFILAISLVNNTQKNHRR